MLVWHQVSEIISLSLMFYKKFDETLILFLKAPSIIKFVLPEQILIDVDLLFRSMPRARSARAMHSGSRKGLLALSSIKPLICWNRTDASLRYAVCTHYDDVERLWLIRDSRTQLISLGGWSLGSHWSALYHDNIGRPYILICVLQGPSLFNNTLSPRNFLIVPLSAFIQTVLSVVLCTVLCAQWPIIFSSKGW